MIYATLDTYLLKAADLKPGEVMIIKDHKGSVAWTDVQNAIDAQYPKELGLYVDEHGSSLWVGREKDMSRPVYKASRLGR